MDGREEEDKPEPLLTVAKVMLPHLIYFFNPVMCIRLATLQVVCSVGLCKRNDGKEGDFTVVQRKN